MKLIGASLIDLATNSIVWSGDLPSRIELRDDSGKIIVRADFDKTGLIIPDGINPTHRMVERVEIEPLNVEQVRGSCTESFDGVRVIIDPHWTDPPPMPPVEGG